MAGGAVAVYCLAQPRLSAALPGVAIATALMPPLCVVGLGLSLGQMDIWLGALLLFVTNWAAISFSGIAVFLLLGFRPVTADREGPGLPREAFISATLVLLVTVPLVISTLRFVDQARRQRDIQVVVADEVLRGLDAQLVTVDITGDDATGLHLEVTVRTGQPPRYSAVVALQAAIAGRLQRAVALQLAVVPITRLDPLIPPTPTPTSTAGPSATATITRTPTQPATPTATMLPPTATPTATPTPTITPTPTPSPTATPVTALVVNTGGQGAALRAAPAGSIIAFLAEGAVVRVLYNRASLPDGDWLEVAVESGQIGWLPARQLAQAP